MEHQLTKTTPKLSSWSWGKIQKTYLILGIYLQEYKNVKERVAIPAPNIKFNDQENIFLIRFNNEIRRVDAMLQLLDNEIARRNSLIGVMG